MPFFSKLFRRGLRFENPALKELFGRQMRWLHAQDPDTSRQWKYLRAALQSSQSPAQEHRTTRAFRFLKPAIGFGLVAAAFVIVGVIWFNRVSMLTYETGKGQQSSIVLADSSEVTLNHTSELIVERSPGTRARRVTLKGEAFFRVRRNGSPFIISTDVGSVQVLGTEFNVRVRDGEMLVAVLKGSVRVSAQDHGRDSAVVLAAGQVTSCSRGEFPGSPGELPFADYPGWMHGKFLFYKTSLPAVCREIESQFDVSIRIQNQRLNQESITGLIDGQTVESALATITSLTGSAFRHEKTGYILY